MTEDELVKKTLETSKTIAMVGVSSIKKEISTNIRRRPSFDYCNEVYARIWL